MVCLRHDEILPLASSAAGRCGTSVIGGDTADDNQIIDPAAAATLPDANACIACMAGIVGIIHGDEMTSLACNAAIAIMVPPNPNIFGVYHRMLGRIGLKGHTATLMLFV